MSRLWVLFTLVPLLNFAAWPIAAYRFSDYRFLLIAAVYAAASVFALLTTKSDLANDCLIVWLLGIPHALITEIWLGKFRYGRIAGAVRGGASKGNAGSSGITRDSLFSAHANAVRNTPRPEIVSFWILFAALILAWELSPIFYAAPIPMVFLWMHKYQLRIRYDLTRQDISAAKATLASGASQLRNQVHGLAVRLSGDEVSHSYFVRAEIEDDPRTWSNVEPLSFHGEGLACRLYPDGLLLRQGRTAIASTYRSLTIEAGHEDSETRHFSEDEMVVRMAWEHARMDGSPDGRYKSNEMIYTVRYPTRLLSLNGEDHAAMLLLRTYAAAEEFDRILRQISADFSYVPESHAGTSGGSADARGGVDDDLGGRDSAPPRESSGGRPWHLVLGVAFDASLDDIKTARRKLAQGLHPDKLQGVQGLDQRIIDYANAQLAELNSAYDQAVRERGE